MFSIRKRRRSKGFILIYVMFIVSFCIFIALNCFKLEVLKRQNSLNMKKDVLKVDSTQKIKEYMLTDLDELLYKNVTVLTNDGIKSYLSSLISTRDSIVTICKYDNSCIEYNKDKDWFVVTYYVNNKFYKEEVYRYKVENNLIFYNYINYFFKKGAELEE
ncbi:hypothetical protein [Clostridium sp. JS66]|uniref:hypothetical protein n=1 Tax=Clostridium sp. JS66 TaxID=3064705 RepID=UPI00298EC6ED|nr:hypothetical protein [Clostridium sp. JS66]WPC44855.1 hypothetical protein Q6H37_24005 [Clostridium sp. JS66]